MQCVWNVLLDPLRNQPHDKLACSKPHPTPLVDRDLAKKQQHSYQQQQFQFKRKRASTLDASPQKRQKNDNAKSTGDRAVSASVSTLPTTTTETASPQVPALKLATPAPSYPAQVGSESVATAEPAPVEISVRSSDVVMDPDAETKARTRAHERIEANLNLQILLKHDELRLIEQELGKCQIALEQLRRCHVMPYPGQPGSQTSTDKIITGTGAALQSPQGYTRPDYPAPFGVVDGPYSRHYAQWLIPDSNFDPSLPRQPRTSVLSQAGPGRSTRGAYDNLAGFTTPRVGRPSLVSQNAAGHNSYAVPRDRHAPLIVPRPSDGQLVKVVCKICGKKDSANVQGFTNHCRIAHGINYASHSEAIIDCGHPVNNDEAPPSATPQSAAPTPVETKPQSVISTPQQVQPPQQPVGKPFVHPLITAPTPEPKDSQSVFNGAAPPLAKGKSDKKSTSKSNDNFIACAKQPNLSALLKKRGFNGDLKALVTSAQQKIDLDQVSPLISDDEDEPQSANTPTSTSSTPSRPTAKPKIKRGNIGSVRMPARAPVGPSRLQINTSNNVGVESHSPADSPMDGSTAGTPSVVIGHGKMSTSFASSTLDSPMDIDQNGSNGNIAENGSSSANLSPRTADTMPGLVTDNEDEPDYVDSEQESSTQDEETLQRARLVDMGVRVRDADENSQQGDDIMRHFDPTGTDCGAKSQAQAPTIPHAVAESSTPRKRGRPRKH